MSSLRGKRLAICPTPLDKPKQASATQSHSKVCPHYVGGLNPGKSDREYQTAKKANRIMRLDPITSVNQIGAME